MSFDWRLDYAAIELTGFVKSDEQRVLLPDTEKRLFSVRLRTEKQRSGVDLVALYDPRESFSPEHVLDIRNHRRPTVSPNGNKTQVRRLRFRMSSR
jgi:hypothetical protein